MKNVPKSKKLLAVLFLCVFLSMFVMTSLTPMLADDFSYSFSYADRSRRMQSIADVLPSLAAHYRSMNGRMVPHALAMLFLLLPKAVFNICNALNACLLLFALSRFVSGEKPIRAAVLTLLSLFLIWTFTPAFGQSYLWLDGSLNYSWSVTFLLLFLYPFYCEYRDLPYRLRSSRLGQLAFLLLALAAGAYSENASSAGIFIALCFAVLTRLRRARLPAYLYAALAFAGAGYLSLIIAPAERGRALQGGLLSLARNVQRVFEAPQQTLLWLIVLFAVLLVVAAMRRVDRRILASSLIFFLGAAASVGIYVFALYLPWRGLCSTTVFLVLACVLLLRGLWDQGLRYPAPVLAAAFAVSFFFSFVLALGDIAVLSMEGKQRDALLRRAAAEGAAYVEVHRYSANTKYAASHDLPDVYDDSALWPNLDIAKYYGVGAVAGLPPVEDFQLESAEAARP